MKDRQTRVEDTSGHIPIVSPVLHAIAMTGLVFLRADFGIVFLRHKSVFLSFAWAQILFSIYAALEPGVFARYPGEVIFGTTAALLYIAHLSLAVARQIQQTGKHDQYSGKSHLLRFLKSPDESTEMHVHLWIEPLFVLSISFMLRLVPGVGGLTNWLSLLAIVLCCNETINYWYHLRRIKRPEDMIDDTKETVGENLSSGTPPPLRSARKGRVKRPGVSDET